MEIIKVDDSRYDKYEELLIHRDTLRKEAEGYLVMYINRFGELEAQVFKKKIDCISRKKAISFCAMYANKGQTVNLDALREYIKKNTEEYREHLENMIKNNEACRELKTVTEAAAMEVKQIYRRIAKKMHPDINPVTDNDPVFLELWQRIDIAYRRNDLKEMRELEVLSAAALEQAGSDKIVIDIPDIDEKISEVKAEINEILTTDPYMYKHLLEDSSCCEEKEKQLLGELEEYRKYDEELKAILKNYVKNGVTITWETI